MPFTVHIPPLLLCSALESHVLAVAGHRLAWEKAGVLHRDVSVGNILIADDPGPDGSLGFLHDFDCSSMADIAPGDPEPNPSEDNSAPLNDRRKEKIVSVVVLWPLVISHCS